MHRNLRKILPILLIAMIAVVGYWYFTNYPLTLPFTAQAAETGELTASGTVEATQTTLSPEVGGRLEEVLVEEGQTVQAGQILVRFSDTILQSQLKQAQAQLKLAQANFDLVATGSTNEQRQSSVTAAQLEIEIAQQALNELSEKADLVQVLAEQAIATADKALDKASARLDSLQSAADQTDIDSAQATVVLTKDQLDKARKDFEPYQNKPEDNLVRAMLQNKLASAQEQYDAAVTRLNNLTGKSNPYDLAIAVAEKNLTQEQLTDARRHYEKVKNGPDPAAVTLAEDRLAVAKAHLTAAQADPTPQQLAVVRAQIDVALATMDVIQAQIGKLVILSPTDGVVLSRSVEPGETVLPGANLLTLARLDRLTITVYVAEDRYGAINLGQTVEVSTDSFPGVTFTATVVHIADKAEFTPRNVQTAEGRRTTVFAVKMTVENQDNKLKPGMPVDVTFVK